MLPGRGMIPSQSNQPSSNHSLIDSSIISINVGGTIYTTHRDTLSRKINGKDHLLSVMFSNEDNFQFSRDRHGNIFIDRNGQTFTYILDYLRAGGDMTRFAMPFNDPYLMEQLEAEVEYFNLDDWSTVLRGPRKSFKIEKKKHGKIKTLNTPNGLMSPIDDFVIEQNKTLIQKSPFDDKEDESIDDEDNTCSILMDENDDDENDGYDSEEDDSIHVKQFDSSSDEDSDSDDFHKNQLTANLKETSPSSQHDEEDEESISTFDAAIKSVNNTDLKLVIKSSNNTKETSPSQKGSHSGKRLKRAKASLFYSYHNIKHKICNDRGEPVIGYSEDASICYIYPNLSRYYYPIICKQPIKVRGVDRRFTKCCNYYEISIDSDLEDIIDHVNYNIPGIVVAVMTNKNIKVLKEHHQKDLPIDLRKETVANFNLKNGSYYSNEDGKHVIGKF